MSEPTIYKPSAYKTPGVYKGAGGIYKGRGVYKDGNGGLKVWELDIKNLVLSNHTDADGLNYTFSGNFSKLDSDTKLCGTSYFEMWIYPIDIIGTTKKIEIIASEINIGNYAYIGSRGAFFRKSYDFQVNGCWLGYLQNGEQWTNVVGDYFGSTPAYPYNFIGYQNINVTLPLKYELYFGERVELYFNDELIAYKNNDYDLLTADIFKCINFSSGGQSNPSNKVVIDSINFWYE